MQELNCHVKMSKRVESLSANNLGHIVAGAKRSVFCAALRRAVTYVLNNSCHNATRLFVPVVVPRVLVHFGASPLIPPTTPHPSLTIGAFFHRPPLCHPPVIYTPLSQ